MNNPPKDNGYIIFLYPAIVDAKKIATNVEIAWERNRIIKYSVERRYADATHLMGIGQEQLLTSA